MQRLSGFHRVPVVVADEVQHRVHERRAPVVADHLRTDDDVAELARQSLRQIVERVDRERERIRRLVDPKYVSPLPTVDGWGRPFTWAGAKREYCIASSGSDGVVEHSAAQALATDRKRYYLLRDPLPEDEIVFCTGSFQVFLAE